MGAGFNLVIHNDTDPGPAVSFKFEILDVCVEHVDRIYTNGLPPGTKTGGYLEAISSGSCAFTASKLTITVLVDTGPNGRDIVGSIYRDAGGPFPSGWKFATAFPKDSHGVGGWGAYKLVNTYDDSADPSNHVQIVENR